MERLCFCAALLISSIALAQLPGAPRESTQWPMPWGPEVPGRMAVDLPKPAGQGGNIVARNGHFYSGKDRVRFWGVNIAFAGDFPTHEQADEVAQRLSRYGFNCVRLHHMDMQPFPNGIWADAKCEKLSDEAIDRLDYFIAALKRQGVYSNINLHVSRWYSRNHNWENADKLESFDKMVDLFHPDLIAAQKQYARDLLTHVNKYTNTRLADDPAVGIVEINNEDGIFMWGADQKLQTLPEPYAGILAKLWNGWLAEKYRTREELKAAWAVGEQPLGPNLLANAWAVEQHDAAKMRSSAIIVDGKPGYALTITAVDDTSWHLQFSQPRLRIRKGHFYTLQFKAQSSIPNTDISVAVAQAHEPWNNLGLAPTFTLGRAPRPYVASFVATADDENARVSFSVGRKVAEITLSDMVLAEGGRMGLADGESPGQFTVLPHGKARPATPARVQDWYRFLHELDEKYWIEMYRFLKQDVGVKCAVTGTIGFGPLGTLAQSKLDFVDQHSYWEHPYFPHREWDMSDWVIGNKPMSDNPAGATLWALAATRIEGKPFTVTEYQHSAPNEWQAECMPMIAAYAALQDWDGIFVFAYTHSNRYQKDKMEGFFDIEGNALKMAPSPLAARIFLGRGVEPLAGSILAHPTMENILATTPAHWHESWSFLRQFHNLNWQKVLANRLAVSYEAGADSLSPGLADPRIAWSAAGPATGQFLLKDSHAAVFAGFPGGKPIDLGAVRIEQVDAPFVTVIAVPANPKQALEQADRILISVVARAENTGIQWNGARTSVGNQWGSAPMRLEVVGGSVALRSDRPVKVRALSGKGEPAGELPVSAAGGWFSFKLGQTAWYEVTR